MASVEETSRVLREVHRRVLRRLREEVPRRRLTQRELARRVGLSREQVVALEGGRSALSENALARYLAAHELGVSAFYEMAARVAAEVERLEAGDARSREGADAATADLPPGAAILWQRETHGELLVLVQLSPGGAARLR